jgi:SAM-dependent methyltransferase
VSFDQNQDIKGEKKPSVPPEEATPQNKSSNYEDFGTSGVDTLIEMPAIDSEVARLNKASTPESKTPEAEAPVSSEALAWLSGDETPPAEPASVGSTLIMPKLVGLEEPSQEQAETEEAPNTPEAQEPIKLEAPKMPEAPKLPEAPKMPEAPKLLEATKLPEAPKTSETPQRTEAPKASDTEEQSARPADSNEDSLELVEEIKAENEDGEEADLSGQIGWSKGLPEKQEVEAKPPPPLPKAPPPTPKAPPPFVPSGPQKAVTNPNVRLDTPKKPISKLDLPPELFEDAPPTKTAETVPSPTPTVQLPKMLPKGWWDTIFNEDFLRTNPAKSEAMTRKEADFIEQCLVPKPGDSILDVACGYGRHVIEMGSRNYNMVGLDLSLPYLMLAAEISTRRKLTANFIHGDMRDLQFKEYFDHAYCVFTSFGYFDDETNLESLRGVYRSLKPKGRFLLEVINRDFAVSACPLRGWWEGIGCVMLEETEFNYSSSMLTTKRSVIFEDGRQAMQETHVRLYSLHELTALYKATGFKILEVSGGVDLRGVFFGADSTHLVILAEKQR